MSDGFVCRCGEKVEGVETPKEPYAVLRCSPRAAESLRAQGTKCCGACGEPVAFLLGSEKKA